jgi:carbon storage regulator CsrA
MEIMLCLSRREGQAVKIGDVIIHVSKIHGNYITLAIDAPKDVKILRAELEEKCQPPE